MTEEYKKKKISLAEHEYVALKQLSGFNHITIEHQLNNIVSKALKAEYIKEYDTYEFRLHNYPQGCSGCHDYFQLKDRK